MTESFFLWEELLPVILQQYALSVTGLHGIAHWARVFENGTHLARTSGACVYVVQLFALLHDSKRTHDGWDTEHGHRGAEYAGELRRDGTLTISDEELNLLYVACDRHTDGLTEADITIQVCWDADRLDLCRVGIVPKPNKLCTRAARQPDLLHWANSRAIQNIMPEWVSALDNAGYI
jgi:uncharacterized protein